MFSKKMKCGKIVLQVTYPYLVVYFTTSTCTGWSKKPHLFERW